MGFCGAKRQTSKVCAQGKIWPQQATLIYFVISELLDFVSRCCMFLFLPVMLAIFVCVGPTPWICFQVLCVSVFSPLFWLIFFLVCVCAHSRPPLRHGATPVLCSGATVGFAGDKTRVSGIQGKPLDSFALSSESLLISTH